MVNRYIKCIADGHWDTDIKAGEYLKIIEEKLDVYKVSWKNYNNSAFSKDRLTNSDRAFELMPEGWTPDNVDNNCLLNLQIW